jgi:transcription termination/antitermination protein NusG
MAVAYQDPVGLVGCPETFKRERKPVTQMHEELPATKWFALQVRTRWEGSTESLLAVKGYETFLPKYTAEVRRAGRLKEAVLPLFPGYVFCRFDPQDRLPVLVTPGVISVVSRGRLPIPVEDHELSAVRTIVQSKLPVQPWPYLEIGERVQIQDDSLDGLEGILISFRGTHRVVVSVSLLRRSVALEIARERVVPLRPSRAKSVGMLTIPALSGERF